MINEYKPFKAKILDVKMQTDIDFTFKLENKGMKPILGQFLQVSIPKVGEAPISISDFTDEYIELTIRKVGRVTDVLYELKPGDHLFIRGPYGNGFPIDKYKDKDVIIAAGGTGLAPVKGIIERYYENPTEINSLSIILGFKSPKDILFKEEIERWQKKFDLILTVDKGDENWQGNEGLITEFIPGIPVKKAEDTCVLVVGPPPMMKFSCIEFKNRIPEGNIWVSFERKMSCGIGKCGHCKVNETYVCLEGPVFNYSKSKDLLD